MTELAQTTNGTTPKYRQRRISPKVRTALELKVKEGIPWAKAAQRAGMSEAGIHKARKATHIQEEFERIKGQYINEIEASAGLHKARALEVARELLDESNSDTVKARMVEFLRGEGKPQTQITVQNQVNVGAGGYEFVPPGATVVEVKTGADQPEQPQDVVDVTPNDMPE